MEKSRILLITLTTIFTLSLSLNFMEKTQESTFHYHHANNLISHIHQHSHFGKTHSHTHSSNSYLALDYFFLLDSIKDIKKAKTTFNESLVSNLILSKKIDKPFKPPKTLS